MLRLGPAYSFAGPAGLERDITPQREVHEEQVDEALLSPDGPQPVLPTHKHEGDAERFASSRSSVYRAIERGGHLVHASKEE